ncbi:MAG TPA: hypothetical protein VKP65_25750 [Rhodothermales bacterium]|nr:hypothetical protein [Rhodothermales bacterium]
MEPDTSDQSDTVPGASSFEALPPHGHDPPLPETAREWVEQNQSTAMLTAFAIGVFLGVLMRR